MKKVLIAGSLNMDLIARIQRFPNIGETVHGHGFNEHIGGKGANQASACALQNVPTTLWGMVGDDSYGNIITKSIKELGISSEISKINLHTGLAMIEVSDQGQNRIVVIPGANAQFSSSEVQSKKHLLEAHDIIILQNEIPMDTVACLITEAHKMNKVVIYNPAPAESIPDALLAQIDYLIPNEHELSIISGMPTGSDNEIQSAVLKLLDKGVGCVITSLGDRGLCYTENKKIVFIPANKVEAVDTTGAGDALIGSFAAYLAKDLPLHDALKYASCGASISVTRFGAFATAGTEQEIIDSMR